MPPVTGSMINSLLRPWNLRTGLPKGKQSGMPDNTADTEQ